MDFLVSTDSLMLGPRGAIFAKDVMAGDQVLLLGRDGRPRFVPLTKRHDFPFEIAVVRLLTTIGDIAVPQGSRVITRTGPRKGREIAVDILEEIEVDIEVLDPRELAVKPPPSSTAVDDVVRDCLSCFKRGVIQFPRVGHTDATVKQVEALLAKAEVDFKHIQDGRWVAFPFNRGALPDRPLRPTSSAKHLEILLTLTMWDDDEMPSFRTRIEEDDLRRHLFAALISQAQPFRAVWTPRYHPVECKVELRDESEAPFAMVVAVTTEHVPGVVFQTELDGRIVVGLGLLGPSKA